MFSATTPSYQERHRTFDNRFEEMMTKLHDTYQEMVRELREQKSRQDADTQAAWAELGRQRDRSGAASYPSQPYDNGVPASSTRTPPPPIKQFDRQPSGADASALHSQKQRTLTHCSPGGGGSPLQSTFSYWITVWPGFHRNGNPVRVFVHSNYKHISHVIQRAAEDCRCNPPPGILYTPDGKTVTSLEQLVPSGNYLIFPSGALYREESVPTALLELLAFTMRSSLSAPGSHVPQYRSNSSVPVPFTAEY